MGRRSQRPQGHDTRMRAPLSPTARIADLERALRPFARFTHEVDAMKRQSWEVLVPVDGCVSLYVGKPEQIGKSHLHTDDFRVVRRVLGLCQ